ncbi:hypothetical protein AURDEDRAFT_126457 [Auricularia subglabra TFB-10046 SS5]|nr:hypothetical protein AURDEDRAFT_126457 [Auricularia subglabra TFB-10046 SS5]
MSGQPPHPNQPGRINLPPIRQVLSESFPPQQGRPQQRAAPAGVSPWFRIDAYELNRDEQVPPYGGQHAYPHPAQIQRAQTPLHGPIPPQPQQPPPPVPGHFHVLVSDPARQGNFQTRQAGPGTIVRQAHPEGPVTAQRPRRFQCQYPDCHHAFDRQAALENHVRTHTGDRPFKCAYCPADFTTNSNLKRHERDQHGAR